MEDPYGCTESEHTGLRVGGPLQQTHAGGMNPLRAQSNTRWQCVSVASGHLAGCLDRKVCCKRLWDPAVQSSSDGLTEILIRLQGCEVSVCKKPQS